jgi:hypothetical protein
VALYFRTNEEGLLGKFCPPVSFLRLSANEIMLASCQWFYQLFVLPYNNSTKDERIYMEFGVNIIAGVRFGHDLSNFAQLVDTTVTDAYT